MDIQQAKAAKAQLDKNIAELLNKFSADTGLAVEYVNIEYQFIMGASTRYIVGNRCLAPQVKATNAHLQST
jgi:hypothetical protein